MCSSLKNSMTKSPVAVAKVGPYVDVDILLKNLQVPFAVAPHEISFLHKGAIEGARRDAPREVSFLHKGAVEGARRDVPHEVSFLHKGAVEGARRDVPHEVSYLQKGPSKVLAVMLRTRSVLSKKVPTILAQEAQGGTAALGRWQPCKL